MENENDSSHDEIDYNELTSTKLDKTVKSLNTGKKLIVILEHANLELTTSKRDPEILNSDDHPKLIKKMGKNLEEYRPDVTHQVRSLSLN